MKYIIYISVLVLTLSCNKKDENSAKTSKKEPLQSSKSTISTASNNLDSLFSENSQKNPEISTDIALKVSNDAIEINKQLDGVWNVIEISNNKPDNIIGIIYMFDARKKTLEVYNADELRGQYNYSIEITNCEGNKKNTDSCYIKLSGDDNYCSKIVDVKHKNNKIYLILKDFITESQDKEFLKISDDPKFFPRGFR